MSATHNTPKNASDIADQLHRSALRFMRVLRDLRPVSDLSWSRIGVLGCLRREGTATATSLAASLRVKPQSLTRLLADMEDRGLLTRRPNPADQRQSLLQITQAGASLLTQEIGEQRLVLSELMAQELTPAEQELLRLAAGLMDHLASIIAERGRPLGGAALQGSGK